MKIYSLLPTVLLMTKNGIWQLSFIWLGIHLDICGKVEGE